MKILDIGFLKTEPNRPQNSKTENSVSAVRFSKKTISAVSGRFFALSHSQLIFQHDEFRFVFVWLRLRNSKPPPPQPLRTRACPGQEERCTHTAAGDCWWNDRRVAAVKIKEIAILTLKTIGILRISLYSRSPDIRPRKSPETNTCLPRQCSCAPVFYSMPALTKWDSRASPTIWQRCTGGTNSVMLPRTLDKRVWMLKLNSQHRLRSPLPNPLT